jgi:hypothetical protein
MGWVGVEIEETNISSVVGDRGGGEAHKQLNKVKKK